MKKNKGLQWNKLWHLPQNLLSKEVWILERDMHLSQLSHKDKYSLEVYIEYMKLHFTSDVIYNTSTTVVEKTYNSM